MPEINKIVKNIFNRSKKTHNMFKLLPYKLLFDCLRNIERFMDNYFESKFLSHLAFLNEF